MAILDYRLAGAPTAIVLPYRRLAWVIIALACQVGLVSGCKSSGGDGGVEDEQGIGVARVIRGPQLAQLDETSVLIAWLSSQPASGAVELGTDLSFSQRIDSPSRGTEHVLRGTELTPGTRYFYRILLDGSVVSEGHEFETAPAAASAPFRFIAFGDSGSGSANQAAVAARVLVARPALVVIPGDVVYDSGAPGELDPRYFVPFAGLIDRFPFYPALGNHDVRTRNGAPLLEALYLPVNDVDGSERFYSFDHANVHFVALDSTSALTPFSAQWSWLDADLARSRARWKVVYFHHPPYSSSEHGSNFAVRQNLTPLLDRHHVDLVISGHDHNYERTYPLLREQVVGAEADPNYVDARGTIYIVTGGGGRSLYRSGKSYFTAISASVYHFTQVEVDGNALTLKAVGTDGVVFDQVRLVKGGEE